MVNRPMDTLHSSKPGLLVARCLPISMLSFGVQCFTVLNDMCNSAESSVYTNITIFNVVCNQNCLEMIFIKGE